MHDYLEFHSSAYKIIFKRVEIFLPQPRETLLCIPFHNLATLRRDTPA